MREPCLRLYVHLVWCTWDRLPMLTGVLRDRVYACIRAGCKAMGVQVLGIGGVADHVHLLVRLPSTVSVAGLVKQVKGASSHLVTHELDTEAGFKWQGAYGAFTVSGSDVPDVRRYIAAQKHHHAGQGMSVEWELPEIR